MRILFVNDDGFEANGLKSLLDVFHGKHDFKVVAPRFEQSVKSHSLTIHQPLQLSELRSNFWWVDGTPADCIYVALHFLQYRPDIIISGINHGTNLGTDVWYSGTVAAAREGAFHGIKSFAMSTQPLENTLGFFRQQAELVFSLLPNLCSLPELLYNINLSVLPQAECRMANLAKRIYKNRVEERFSPSGRPYYWIGGPPCGFEGDEFCDVALYEQGFTTITPLILDSTAHPIWDIDKKNSGAHDQLPKTNY